MLLLALLLPPLGLYLLVLGWINRRPRPVKAAGTVDFVGILFALSGFFLFGGPALLGSLDEQSRWYWLVGQAASAPAGNAAASLAARLVYFCAVAGVAGLALWRGRRLTSVYNVDPRLLPPALEQALLAVGIKALRSGDAFLLEGKTPTSVHVDAFPLMRHATLRWAPASAPLRRAVEGELAHALAEFPPEPDSFCGGVLSVLGATLLMLALVSAGLLVVLHFYPPR